MLAYISGTATTTGLEVHAERLDGHYATGLSVSDAEMATLNLTTHGVCPTWNYTLCPRSIGASPVGTPPQKREVIL
ncbi:MAG: hypothetical protein DLM70_09295 [Chloroflexi bacterium]|nr:MAG: hypothetical protein DLM70_09295 [Chloroflexota bacterium]